MQPDQSEQQVRPGFVEFRGEITQVFIDVHQARERKQAKEARRLAVAVGEQPSAYGDGEEQQVEKPMGRCRAQAREERELGNGGQRMKERTQGDAYQGKTEQE